MALGGLRDLVTMEFVECPRLASAMTGAGLLRMERQCVVFAGNRRPTGFQALETATT